MAANLLRHGTQERIEAIKAGLPYELFEELADRLDVSTTDLARVIGVPARTLQRRKAEGAFPQDESDRLFRIVRLLERANEVIGAEGPRWLVTPKRFLGGATPLDTADTEVGAWEVHQALGRLEHGVFL